MWSEIYVFYRSDQYQTIIEGYNNQPLGGVDDNDGEHLFGSLVSNSPDYNNIEPGNEYEIPSEDQRYRILSKFSTYTIPKLCS